MRSTDPEDIPDPDAPDDMERRKAILGLGKFAGVTAPAVVTLLMAGEAEVWAGSHPVGRPLKPRPRLKDILADLFGKLFA